MGLTSLGRAVPDGPMLDEHGVADGLDVVVPSWGLVVQWRPPVAGSAFVNTTSRGCPTQRRGRGYGMNSMVVE